MKQQFTIANNVMTVNAPDGLAAWKELAPRYAPFASVGGSEPMIEVNITVAPLPQSEGERIYQPTPASFGLMDSRVSRLADGSLLIELKHIRETTTRLRMRMARGLDRADIIMTPAEADCDPYFLTHALMLAYALAASRVGTLLFHSSTIVRDGKAYLFQGKSGTGKSTHSALWLSNIEGAELLNDDNPLVRVDADGAAIAYGSPWSGKTDCYRNASARVGAFVRIVRAQENSLRRLAPLQAYASLTPSVFFMPFLGEELQAIRHAAIERLAGAVPCCEMYCRPDADAAITCCRELKQFDTH